MNVEAGNRKSCCGRNYRYDDGTLELDTKIFDILFDEVCDPHRIDWDRKARGGCKQRKYFYSAILESLHFII